MAVYGYARVSTKAQSLELQQEALRAAGCDEIFSEKKSGATLSQRSELARLREKVAADDVVLVYRVDRLARSTHELLTIAKELKQKGAHLRALRDSWCDTTSPLGWLLLTILAGVAEFERELIKERTAEGRERAVRNPKKKFGRPRALEQYQEDYVRERRAAGDSIRKIAADLKVGHSTVARVEPKPEAEK